MDIKYNIKINIHQELHTVHVNVPALYVYFLLVRGHIIYKKTNEYMNINLDKYKFSQIFVRVKDNNKSFDNIEQMLTDMGIILLYNRDIEKQEIEFKTFNHQHNYLLLIVNSKIIKKQWSKI